MFIQTILGKHITYLSLHKAIAPMETVHEFLDYIHIIFFRKYIKGMYQNCTYATTMVPLLRITKDNDFQDIY